MNINNRRYTGSKYRLVPLIKNLILGNCPEHRIFFDVFAGTGVVTAGLLDVTRENIVNDFLYSNEMIYRAFFSQDKYDFDKLRDYVFRYFNVDRKNLADNYVSLNYGNRYFNYEDAMLIGSIREDIMKDYEIGFLNEREYGILLVSLLYSLDKCANTVGHYDAYIKDRVIPSCFVFDLITPIETANKIKIFRENANKLARRVYADVAFVDPPYNSRQYSRFYHVLETITKWDKPELFGVARKPPVENMSDYCRNSAVNVLEDLILNLRVKYIVMTYNNTYDSRSSSSRNKIALSQIVEILNERGKTKIFETGYRRFNAGKTEASEHKEYIFITETGFER